MSRDFRTELATLLNTVALGATCYFGNRRYLDRMSRLMCCQLVLGCELRLLHIHGVIGELDLLEGLIELTSTVPSSKFNKNPLCGFRKKHFWQPNNIMKNIGAHWSLGFKEGNHRFSEKVDEILNPHMGQELDDEIIGRLCNETYIGGHIKRAEKKTEKSGGCTKRVEKGKLTGDWIVYKQYQGRNYYLGLFPHSNPNQPDYDNEVYKSLESWCKEEFPYLFESKG